ncbi:riboflavin synthase domain-like protein [Terfezia boudieri ATCC MYA-4762]|uniref:Riboflavin synthase domain-like protein n=1 Tax=Terfezia boudieri ATCC MYA-4762 TaxID=1051890 RepID=A0A3N4LG58_9PEZI|nr:riboflavin synthase domain-like protein [Terfezia boudieri ATCC MYA-4762]
MQLPALGHACDYASPLLAAFMQLEEQYGRETAVKEANLILATLLLRFNLKLDDPTEIVQAQVHPLNLRSLAFELPQKPPIKIPPPELLAKSLCIFYGSYTKTCENLAIRLAAEAKNHKLNVVECDTLDALAGRIPKQLPVFIITSTIHGGPPPNARHFVSWLKSLTGDTLQGTKFAVFGSGAGSRSPNTYQANPKLIEEQMLLRGATRLMQRGVGNAEGSTRRDFAKWKEDYFWPYFDIEPPPFSTDVKLKVSVPKVNPDFTYELGTALVEKNVVLTGPSEPEKRHITLKLPEGMTYKAGDYLSVLPTNPRENVKRAMTRFKLDWNAVLDITEGGLVIPEGDNISPWRVLSKYVELGRLALEGDIKAIAECAEGETKIKILSLLADGVYEKEVYDKKLSPLDLLEKFQQVNMDLGVFLSILPPMEYRRYSISSSPLSDPKICTLTYGVMSEPHKSGTGWFHGVASTYLSRMQEDFIIEVGTVGSDEFHLPKDPEETPVIMICAGTGLSPFRGFVQERAILKRRNPSLRLADALLFIGCRYEIEDRIHGKELDEWQKDGVVGLRYAFSQEPHKSKGCKYVQERVVLETDEVKKLLVQEAQIYVCGSNKVGKGARAALETIYKGMGKSQQEIEDIFDKRLHEDVFE